MPFYAMVVVIEAPDDDAAYEGIVRGIDLNNEIPGGTTYFVGHPWEARPREPFNNTAAVDEAPEFDTLHTIDQHPERRS